MSAGRQADRRPLGSIRNFPAPRWSDERARAAWERTTVRLTVIGSGPAAPQPDSPASGHLIRSDGTAVLMDCGYGVVGRLRSTMDPRQLTGVVVGHLHADHFLDLAALRYLHPWDGANDGRPAVWLPPGGRQRLAGLARMMSERPTFFEEAFDLCEYRSDESFAIGALSIRPTPMQHYVPAWALTVSDGSGARVVYGGDTGPTATLVETARSADLFIAEATLASVADDEPSRGHCTVDEAIAIARGSGARHVLLTHYASARRAELLAAASAAMTGSAPTTEAAADAASVQVSIAVPGMDIAISPEMEVGREALTSGEAPNQFPAMGLPDLSLIAG
ncbi:MAG TPA: MBL fold metallo-hydrolase [Candidatus Limnocylindria bacterium]|nr:MBL fold metallo-hydrolase [Candidatus Limnocylindria bacterium]